GPRLLARRLFQVVVSEDAGQGADVLDCVAQGEEAAVVRELLSHSGLSYQAFKLHIESACERAQGVDARGLACALLQLADGVDVDAGPGCKFLLGEITELAQAADAVADGSVHVY